MTPAAEWKLCSICFLSFICENTHKVCFKNLWDWIGNRPLDLTPKVTSLTLGWKFYLHSVLLIIPVNLICHMTMSEKKNWPPGCPQRPSPNPEAWPRWQNKKSCLICCVSFICENTHKVWHKNLWNWLCNWTNWGRHPMITIAHHEQMAQVS